MGKIWFEGDLAAIFSRLSNVSVYWFKLWAECFTAYNYRSLYSRFKQHKLSDWSFIFQGLVVMKQQSISGMNSEDECQPRMEFEQKTRRHNYTHNVCFVNSFLFSFAVEQHIKMRVSLAYLFADSIAIDIGVIVPSNKHCS